MYQRSTVQVLDCTKDLQFMHQTVPKIDSSSTRLYQRSTVQVLDSTKDLQFMYQTVPKIYSSSTRQYQRSIVHVLDCTKDLQFKYQTVPKIYSSCTRLYKRSTVQVLDCTTGIYSFRFIPPPPRAVGGKYHFWGKNDEREEKRSGIQNMQALNQVFIPSINNNEQITCLLMKQMKQTNLNLPFHSEYRHNVHQQRSYSCTQCYRCIDRQGRQAVFFPPGGRGKKKKITAWNGRDTQYILLHKKHHVKNTW